MIKRFERARELKEGKTEKKKLSAFGDALWRKLVERNLMKPEKEKPVYKVRLST